VGKRRKNDFVLVFQNRSSPSGSAVQNQKKRADGQERRSFWLWKGEIWAEVERGFWGGTRYKQRSLKRNIQKGGLTLTPPLRQKIDCKTTTEKGRKKNK